MKKNAVVFLLLIVVASCSQKKLKFDNYIATIKDFQYEMNQLAILKKRVGKQITQAQFNRFRQLLNKKREAIAGIYKKLDRDVCSQCPTRVFDECEW